MSYPNLLSFYDNLEIFNMFNSLEPVTKIFEIYSSQYFDINLAWILIIGIIGTGIINFKKRQFGIYGLICYVSIFISTAILMPRELDKLTYANGQINIKKITLNQTNLTNLTNFSNQSFIELKIESQLNASNITYLQIITSVNCNLTNSSCLPIFNFINLTLSSDYNLANIYFAKFDPNLFQKEDTTGIKSIYMLLFVYLLYNIIVYLSLFDTALNNLIITFNAQIDLCIRWLSQHLVTNCIRYYNSLNENKTLIFYSILRARKYLLKNNISEVFLNNNEKLYVVKFEEYNCFNEECPICFDKIEIITNCSHGYCCKCLQHSLTNCSLCRTEINKLFVN